MKEISPILKQKAVSIREVPNYEHVSGDNWSAQAIRKKPAYQILDTAKAERTEVLGGSSNFFQLCKASSMQFLLFSGNFIYVPFLASYWVRLMVALYGFWDLLSYAV